MRLIDLCELRPEGQRVHHLQMASDSQGLQLGVLVGDEQSTYSAHWLALPEGEEIRRRNLPVFPQAPTPAFAPDGSGLAFMEQDGDTLQLVLERHGVVPFQRRAVPAGALNGFAFSSDGARLHAFRNDEIIAWDVAAFFTAPEPSGNDFEALVGRMSEGGCNGRLIAVAPSSLSVHSNADGTCSMLFQGDWGGWIDPPVQGRAVTAFAFSPDSKLLGVSHGSTVSVWDMIDEDEGRDEVTLRFTLPDHGGSVNAVAFSPDGRTFATAGTDGEVHLWASEDGHPRKCYIWEVGELTSLAFSPDGSFGAVGTTDGRILLWDLK